MLEGKFPELKGGAAPESTEVATTEDNTNV
jgi:hypothetical protein